MFLKKKKVIRDNFVESQQSSEAVLQKSLFREYKVKVVSCIDNNFWGKKLFLGGVF